MAVEPLHSTLRNFPPSQAIVEERGFLIAGEPVLVSPIVARGFETWAATRQGTPLPLADSLKAEALASILPYVYLVDVLWSRRPGAIELVDFEYRLLGTDIVSHTEADNTGQRLSSIAGQGSQATLIRLYTLAAEAGEPALQRIAYQSDTGRRQWYETLVMPMALERGGPVARLLGVAEHFSQTVA